MVEAMAIARTIPVSTHGRYLVESPTHGVPAGVLVGCHGYAETADTQLQRLRAIPGAGRWLLVSVEGLHRFYRGRTHEVVASWMTRQDREAAIADNIEYLAAVVDDISREMRLDLPVLYTGFSQGVAMAFRAACSSRRPPLGVVAAGGDVPPELSLEALGRTRAVIIARGAGDTVYTLEQWRADQARLRAAGVDVRPCDFQGGHEWHDEVGRQAAALLHPLSR
jgi:predicted esterase